MGCCATKPRSEIEFKENVRGCTDVFWLSLYIAFWFLMVRKFNFYFVFLM